tara:strand:+ start:18395 stop:21058 length:2664 start_codon:yes stop_codon:yes gene_type:complete
MRNDINLKHSVEEIKVKNPKTNKATKLATTLLTSVIAVSSALAVESPGSGGELASNDVEVIGVIGSYIKRQEQADRPSPVEIIDAGNIEKIGAFGAVDIVNSLSINAGSQNNNDGFNQTFSLGTSNINLRGLGVSSTLTLLNGRRQVNTAATTLNGDQFTDLNSLVPTIAIGRVEILKDGASSLYGSDAVAGVANFNTKSDFVGLDFNLDYKSTTSDSQNDGQFSVLYGHEFDNSNLILAASYFDRSPLSAATRSDEFELRDANSTFGNPGTFLVFQDAGAPQFVADPSCEQVAAEHPETTTGINAAGFCNFDFGDYFSMVAEEQRSQVYAEFNSDLSDETSLFAEIGYNDNKILTTSSPSQPILFSPFIPPTNPSAAAVGNTQGALFFGRPFGTSSDASIIDIGSVTWRTVLGLKGELDNNWSWQAAVGHSENVYKYNDSSDTLVDRFQAALVGQGGPNNDLFYNPLYGAQNDPSVIEDFKGSYAFEATSKLTTFDAHVSGEIFELPEGTVALAAGVQYRKNELEYDYNDAAENDNLYFFRGNNSFTTDGDASAVFVEMDIPVFAGLNIQTALRYEDLGNFDTVDPKIGFIWLFEQLSFRGTYGESFKAPSLFQTAGGLTVPSRVLDPVTNALATVSQRTEGDQENPLTAQTSDTYNLGATWFLPDNDFSASIDYWRFNYDKFITPENATALVANDPYGDQLERDPNSGQLTTVTTFFRNAGVLETDGIDVSINKDFDTNIGEIELSVNTSYVLTYDLEDPIAGSIDGKNQRNFTNFGVPMPALRGAIGVTWKGELHSSNIFVRHVSDYEDDNSDNSIDSFTTVDMQFNYDLGSQFKDGTLAALTLGVKNLFDEQAPDVISRSGYDPLTHNALGRQAYLSLKVSFE